MKDLGNNGERKSWKIEEIMKNLRINERFRNNNRFSK